MSSELPRVLVGCPTCDLKADSLEKYIQGLNTLTYPNLDVVIEDNSPSPDYSKKIKKGGKEWEKNHPGKTFRVIYSGQISPKARARLVHGRNKIREIALKENYDYFFSLEQDVIPPTPIIETLLSRKKEIISGVYLNKKTEKNQNKLVVMGGIYGNDYERQNKIVRSIGLMQLMPSRVMEVAYAGLGCMLISRNALEKAEFRYEEANLACDDVYFCMDLQKQNIPIFLDSSAWCGHHFNDAFKKTEY